MGARKKIIAIERTEKKKAGEENFLHILVQVSFIKPTLSRE
jgi:hypothetical protein